MKRYPPGVKGWTLGIGIFSMADAMRPLAPLIYIGDRRARSIASPRGDDPADVALE